MPKPTFQLSTRLGRTLQPNNLPGNKIIISKHFGYYLSYFYTLFSDFVYQQLRAVRDIDLPLFYPQYPYTKW